MLPVYFYITKIENLSALLYTYSKFVFNFITVLYFIKSFSIVSSTSYILTNSLISVFTIYYQIWQILIVIFDIDR